MEWSRRFALLSAMVLLLIGTILAGTMHAVAQEDDDDDNGDNGGGIAVDVARPAHIHAGSCDSIGEVVAPLNDLTEPEGTEAGQSPGNLPQYSFSTVELPLEDILAGDHAVNVHESADNIDNYIACGNIGGVVDSNGSLVIGLYQQNDSGYAGIAVLTPNAENPSTTDVSTFLQECDDEGFESATGADDATGEADTDSEGAGAGAGEGEGDTAGDGDEDGAAGGGTDDVDSADGEGEGGED